MKKTTEQVMAEYKEAVRELYGDERAAKSAVYAFNGYVYINLAQTFADGSCGVIGPSRPYRRKKVMEMTENLRRRAEMKAGGGEGERQ